MPRGIYQHHSHQGFQLGYVPTEEHREKLSEAKIGKKQSSEHVENRRLASIGHKAWNKGVPEGEGNAWKGDNVGYSGLHAWVRKHKGKPQECVYCGKESWISKLEWANIDHKYKRDLDDFIPLCTECHRNYDYKNNLTHGN